MLSFDDFIKIHILNHQINHRSFLTKLEADYFLNPDKYDYITYKGEIIDLSKCIAFDNKKAMYKYVKKINYEKNKADAKAQKELEANKREEANNLINAAMVDFNLRKEKEKQLRREKEQKENKINNQIRNRHGFDENSFMQAISGKKYN
jgi:hypothetical protein